VTRGGKVQDAFLSAAEPFAWMLEDGTGSVTTDPASLNSRRVTQCALSRICGVCAEPLGRPIVLVGTEAEEGRNAFHAPPLHEGCASALLARGDVGEWRLTRTPAFEFVRPNRDDLDQRVTFQPNSLL